MILNERSAAPRNGRPEFRPYRYGASRPAWMARALQFTAECECGCPIEGFACWPCLLSSAHGCLTCWDNGAGHRCPVKFGPLKEIAS